jgi:hypothetical protein
MQSVCGACVERVWSVWGRRVWVIPVLVPKEKGSWQNRPLHKKRNQNWQVAHMMVCNPQKKNSFKLHI